MMVGQTVEDTTAGNVTRGHGLLEGFLARQRARMANKLIRPALRTGRILDVGCGSYPFFLHNTAFREKYGVDQVVEVGSKPQAESNGLTLLHYDAEEELRLPFDTEYFDVVTMLAVFEHIKPEVLPPLLNEIYRVLKPGGMYVMTTPASWSDGLLKIMARLRLVSADEIDEHEDAYTHGQIASVFQQTDFSESQIKLGYFEMFLNMWATASK